MSSSSFVHQFLPLERLPLSDSGLLLQTIAAAGFLVSLYNGISFLKTRASTKRLPPGPPGLPFIGNALQIYKDAWITFTQWQKKYGSFLSDTLKYSTYNFISIGDLIYIHVANQPIIIINSHEVAADLLDRRADIYSSRPNWIGIH